MSAPLTIRNYKTVNREAWTHLFRQGNESSRPVGTEDLPYAKESLDPGQWIRWPEVHKVLCLACGGGQQAPLFASLGLQVVSADLCPEQLKQDRKTARRHSLEIECIEADMLDLSALYDRDFDLVYQAISACYIPNVRRLYEQVARVLRPGGCYRVEHWSPVSMQLADDPWTGRGYELVRPCIPGHINVWKGIEDARSAPECWHYIHTLGDLIGGLCDAGFRILHLAERENGNASAPPGSHAHMAAYVQPFFSLYGQRCS